MPPATAKPKRPHPTDGMTRAQLERWCMEQEWARRVKERGLRVRLPETEKPQAISLAAYVEKTTPWTLEDWQRAICDRLEQLVDQKGQRILIHSFPQAGKSIIVSQRFPSYVLGRSPQTRVRLCCYGQQHAERFSKVNLQLLQDPTAAECFPEEGARVPKLASAREWSTHARAGALDGQPSFSALGIAGPFVGMGADLLIVDDPYKDRQSAFSDVTNEAVWRWWLDTVSPRLNPDSNVVVMFHRWHSRDLAGRLLEQGGWELLRYPAIADGEPGDSSGLPPGSALSKRYSVEFLRNQERDMGQWMFASLYQGLPRPAEGALFKADDIRRYRREPGRVTLVRRDGREQSMPTSSLWRFQTVDLAVSEKSAADWTVVSTWGVTPQGDLLLLHCQRERVTGPEHEQFMVSQAQQWAPAFVLIEENGIGLPTVQRLRQVHGYPVRGYRKGRKDDKRSWAMAAAGVYSAGRIFHPDAEANPEVAPWLDLVESELLSFTGEGGGHDDIVDTISAACQQVENRTAVTSEFNPLTHVAADPAEWDPKLPLLVGWARDPGLAAVAVQVNAQGQAVVLCDLAAEGANPGLFCDQWADLLLRTLADPTTLDLRQYGDAQGLGEGEGNLQREWRELARAARRGTVLTTGYDDLDGTPLREDRPSRGWTLRQGARSDEERLQTVRDRLQRLVGGLPALLLDPDATHSADAMGGGCRYRLHPLTQLPTPEVERNLSRTVVMALGNALSRVTAARKRVEDEDEWEGWQEPRTRAPGRR